MHSACTRPGVDCDRGGRASARSVSAIPHSAKWKEKTFITLINQPYKWLCEQHGISPDSKQDIAAEAELLTRTDEMPAEGVTEGVLSVEFFSALACVANYPQ